MCFDEPIKFIFPCLLKPDVDDSDDYDNIYIQSRKEKRITTSMNIHFDRHSNYTPVTKTIRIITPNSNILDLNYINHYAYSSSNLIKK